MIHPTSSCSEMSDVPVTTANGLGLPSWPASNHQPVASRISTLT
jgi:hypothetical protein